MLKFSTALLALFFSCIGVAHAQTTTEVSYPCSVVLHSVKSISSAQGTALITKVKKPYTSSPSSPIRERQSVGIYADWLPSPSSFGHYDQYEGFSQIPGEISWRFKMYPVKEHNLSWFGGNPWVGKFDEISAKIPKNAIVEVRPSNSKTEKLGPAILQNTLQGCKPCTAPTSSVPAAKQTQDSEKLRLQDMLMNMLTPYIREDLQKYYYPKIFKDFGPQVSPWNIEVIETRRVNGFRGLLLEITFEIEPYDGEHHVRVGKDRMTYLVTFGPTVKLINHTHLKIYKYPPE
ncbi:Protein of unknown function [Bacillus sp. OV166]|uniref:DUF3888 domain-containing protein n=1 Tax=Bacillus sp. OV166 TaxID=1882763 RepID=UPI000A2AA412|nr:Protein of unknown function [Bacillus sp. OV166]